MGSYGWLPAAVRRGCCGLHRWSLEFAEDCTVGAADCWGLYWTCSPQRHLEHIKTNSKLGHASQHSETPGQTPAWTLPALTGFVFSRTLVEIRVTPSPPPPPPLFGPFELEPTLRACAGQKNFDAKGAGRNPPTLGTPRPGVMSHFVFLYGVAPYPPPSPASPPKFIRQVVFNTTCSSPC